MLIRLTCAGNFARPFWRPIENCLFGIIHIWVVFWLIELERWTVFEQIVPNSSMWIEGRKDHANKSKYCFCFCCVLFAKHYFEPQKDWLFRSVDKPIVYVFWKRNFVRTRKQERRKKKKEKKLHWLQNYTLPCMVVSVNHLKII